MIPGTAIVETNLSAEQSDLRAASDAYVRSAKEENWVKPSNGIADLAKVLMDGMSGEEKPANSYLEQIQADIPTPESQLVEIDSDVRLAAEGLAAVTAEASAFLAEPTAAETIRRSDVMSYETCLVTAQKARSSFVEALQSVAAEGSFDLMPAQDSLRDLDLAISDARKMADRLAVLRSGQSLETS
ncbi:MAG: hypothetical protein QNI84_14635 [Henriciella sp.]|nr:hypothetical protein [Henriciella sp.]